MSTLLINMCNLNIRSLISHVELIFVATLVKYFKSLFNMLGFCLIFYVFVLSVGALYCLSGLCIVCWGYPPLPPWAPRRRRWPKAVRAPTLLPRLLPSVLSADGPGMGWGWMGWYPIHIDIKVNIDIHIIIKIHRQHWYPQVLLAASSRVFF